MSFAAVVRSKCFQIAGAAALAIAVAPASQAAQVTFNLTNGTGNNLSSYNFSSGGVNMTVATSVVPNSPTSPQNFVSWTTPGLCLFANATSAQRCFVPASAAGPFPASYNNLAFTFSQDLNLLSFNVGQTVATNATFGGVSVLSNGVQIGSTASFTGAGRVAFTNPVFVKAGSTVVFNGLSGPANSSFRISDLIVDPVDAPGPLPILGAAGAFHASRRLRRRLNIKKPSVA